MPFIPIHPATYICQCRKRRKFFFNRDGLRIWRCGDCETDDIREYLAGNYGEQSSRQFLANILASPRLVVLTRPDGTESRQILANEVEALRWLERNMDPTRDEFRVEPSPVPEKPRLTAKDFVFLRELKVSL